MSLVLVVGTGTDVGKTFVSSAILAMLARRGEPVMGWKPVASGAAPGSGDAAALSAALGQPLPPPLYSFTSPVSPHLAARLVGETLSIEAIVARAAELHTRHPSLLVETAGGLFSPLASRQTNADLARALPAARILLVAPDRLGVLHDVTACLLAARASGLTVHSIVLSSSGPGDASTGTNAMELSVTTGTRVTAVFPRETYDSPASERAARLVWASLFRPPSSWSPEPPRVG
jgi:dethiobiotin synthetase